MKTLLLTVSFISFIGVSQNWNLVNSDRTVFFQHSDSTHITNTIIVDSSLINGVNTNYYTGYAFKYCDTCAGFNYDTPIIYRYAKELLGFNIENDMSNNQYNLDNNTVQHHSQLGTNWQFNTNLTATVVNVGEQTILGILDSIKVIELSNTDTIIISKNYGVIRYPDFETTGKYFTMVGYHEGQNSYGDYLPNFWRTYDFNVGDVFCYDIDSWTETGNFNGYDLRYKILENTSPINSYSYKVRRYSKHNFTNFSNINTFTINIDTFTLIHTPNAQVYEFPSLNSNLNYSYYEFSNDFGYEKKSTTAVLYSDSLIHLDKNSGYNTRFNFRNHKGTTYIDNSYEPLYYKQLIGGVVNGNSFGTINSFPDDLGFEEKLLQNQLKVYPNPATNQITLKGKFKSIAIYNNIGQMIYEKFNPNQIIEVNQLTKGLYFIKGIDKNDLIFTSKLIIE